MSKVIVKVYLVFKSMNMSNVYLRKFRKKNIIFVIFQLWSINQSKQFVWALCIKVRIVPRPFSDGNTSVTAYSSKTHSCCHSKPRNWLFQCLCIFSHCLILRWNLMLGFATPFPLLSLSTQFLIAICSKQNWFFFFFFHSSSG